MDLLSGVNHIAVLTADLDRFVDFYTDVFGVDVVFTETTPAFRHAIVRTGPTSWLHPAELAGNAHATASPAMFDRGHLDHVALTAATPASFATIRERLVARGATGRRDRGPRRLPQRLVHRPRRHARRARPHRRRAAAGHPRPATAHDGLTRPGPVAGFVNSSHMRPRSGRMCEVDDHDVSRPGERLRLLVRAGAAAERRVHPEARVVAQDLAAGDGHLVDLVGTVGDAQRAHAWRTSRPAA